MIINTVDGLIKRLGNKKRRLFNINKSVRDLFELTNDQLPLNGEVFKLISLTGGFSSISFIKAVAKKEIIIELTASTLRIGEKQFKYLSELKNEGRLESALFFIGALMKTDNDKDDKYNYYQKFNKICNENDWKRVIVNNHSKVILMRTNKNYYILETSSNLNENPKIEQYSFENDYSLYEFYYDFFQALKEVRGFE